MFDDAHNAVQLALYEHNRDILDFFFSSRRRHTRSLCDWSSDVCSSDLADNPARAEILPSPIDHALVAPVRKCPTAKEASSFRKDRSLNKHSWPSGRLDDGLHFIRPL